VYLESWDALNLLLGSHVVWGKQELRLDWCHHSTSSLRRKHRRHKKARSPKQPTPDQHRDQAKSGGILTGSNSTPLGSRRHSRSSNPIGKSKDTNPNPSNPHRSPNGKGSKSDGSKAKVQDLLLKLMALL